MKNFLEDTIDFDKSIINSYIEDYNYPWELLDDLNCLIIKIGKSLNKKQFNEISKNVWINNNAKVDSTARIIGPCIIDEYAEIKFNAYIRENVIIGKKCLIGNSSEIKNSVLFDNSKIPHFNYIGDSILGYNCHFGAGAITSNVKSDESLIKTTINSKIYETKRKKYGALIGDNVEVGCNAVITPGVFINSNSTIYPLVMVRGEILKNKIVKDMNNVIDKKQEKIYIDFDSTLFDTDGFYSDFIKICRDNNIVEEEIESYKSMLFDDSAAFNLDTLVFFLLKNKKISETVNCDIQKNFSIKYVYDDVIPILDKLVKKYELILLTYGNYEYQMKKITSSKLKKYFNEIIITNNSKSQLENVDYQNSIFIDNSPYEVEKFYKRNPKKIIRIRRKNDKKSKIETNVDVPEYVDFYEIYDKELI